MGWRGGIRRVEFCWPQLVEERGWGRDSFGPSDRASARRPEASIGPKADSAAEAKGIAGLITSWMLGVRHCFLR